jgi:hypothetical protein
MVSFKKVVFAFGLALTINYAMQAEVICEKGARGRWYPKNEKAIETEILNALAAIGFYCFKVDRQGTFDPVRKVFRKNHNKYKIAGVSDILGIVAGRFLAIEVKSKVGKKTVKTKTVVSYSVTFGKKNSSCTINQRNSGSGDVAPLNASSTVQIK